MNRKRLGLAMLALILLAPLVSGLAPIAAQQASLLASTEMPMPEYRPGHVIVKLRGEVSAASAATMLEGYDLRYVRTFDGIGTSVWRVPVGEELEIIEQLVTDPMVEYAEPIYQIRTVDHVPNDPLLSAQWAHVPILQSPSAWNITTGSADVTIAVLDTGVDRTHPDLSGKLVDGYDFVANDPDPSDQNGHGTHVAGIAAAATNNALGVAGMDWNARIMPIRVLNAEGVGYTDSLVDGILWAANRGADVLNLSLGGAGSSTSVLDAVTFAHLSGSLVVASMGNDNSSVAFYPAAYSNVLAVAATTKDDVRAPYSNYGWYCDVAAPGGYMTYYHDPNGIYSTMPIYPVYMTMYEGFTAGYDFVHGTSQAAPYVSGLAGLMLAANPALTPAQLQTYLQSTAVDLGGPGRDDYYGYGRIDPGAALRAVVAVLSPILNQDGDGQYLVDWSDAPNATSYTLEEDSDPWFGTPETHTGLTSSQYQVVGQDGGVWYYRVRAEFNAQHSVWSEVQSVRVRPKAPVFSLYPSPTKDDEYQLSWGAVGGATGYLLQEGADEFFSSAETRYTGTATAYLVTGQQGGSWYYRVRAYNRVGNSSWSNVASVAVPPAPLQAPVLHPISNPEGADHYVVAWEQVVEADTYVLEESSDPYFASPSVVYSGGDLQHEVAEQPGGTWRYRVRAYGAAGSSPWSEHQRVVVPVLVYLPAVARNSPEFAR